MTRILLVGCGRMGSALLGGWLDRGLPAQDVVVVEPHLDVNAPRPPDGIVVVLAQHQIPETFAPDVVVLAVKPQMMADALDGYSRFDRAVFLSIAAGKPISFFTQVLGSGAAVVRAMPNTPAAVRRGITVAIAGAGVTQAQKDVCDDLLEAVGSVLWIDDEFDMDAVTAVSGSGPAYVFLLTETLAAAGRKAGLSDGIAATLARQTVIGAGELLRQSVDDPATLRRNVTSPGGTTAAALDVLTAPGGMASLLEEAILAACARSKALGG